jgi:hypothetical protein
MAAAYSAIGTADYAADDSDTTLSPSIPTGSAGDLLVAVVTHNTNRTPSATGWTAYTSTNLSFLARQADGSEGSTVGITLASGYSYAVAVVLRFTGATATGVSAGTQQGNNTWNSTVDLPSVTAESAGAIVWVGSMTEVSANIRSSSSSRSNATERYDALASTGRFVLWIWTEDDTSSGSTGAQTLTLATATNAKIGNALIIPAAAASGAAKPVLFHSYFRSQGW